MKRTCSRMLLGLLLVTAAAAADVAGCSVQKGLYDAWLTEARRAGPRRGLKDSLLRTSSTEPDAEQQKAIRSQYQAFFQCLSDEAGHQDDKALQASCEEAVGDRLAWLVCQSVVYVKNG